MAAPGLEYQDEALMLVTAAVHADRTAAQVAWSQVPKSDWIVLAAQVSRIAAAINCALAEAVDLPPAEAWANVAQAIERLTRDAR